MPVKLRKTEKVEFKNEEYEIHIPNLKKRANFVHYFPHKNVFCVFFLHAYHMAKLDIFLVT